MRYLSVCAGIEAATTAWHELGWEPVAFSEIEPFPSAVLKHHYPDVPNLGDMTKFKEWDIGTIDLLVGGTPCQSFSVAGLRKGLEDPRGNLALTYVGILDKFRPKWFIWENVPGVLSSGSGRDFGSFLGALGQIGYGFAYRVLDAQYFGVAQRRRRVFVVGCLGDWRSAAEVLFEPESLRGDSPPSREKREVTPTLTKECTGVSRTGHNEDGWYVPTIAKCITRGIGQRYDSETETMIPIGTDCYNGSITGDVACTMGTPGSSVNASGPTVMTPIALAENTIGRQPQNGGNGDGFTVGGPMYTLNATGVHGVAQPMAFTTEQTPKFSQNLALTLTKQSPTGGGQPQSVLTNMAVRRLTPVECERLHGVAQPIAFTTEQTPKFNENQALTLTKSEAKHNQSVLTEMAVRRLTPVECERLQGFPDNYTNIPWRKQPESPDGPRYKSLGNSMAVPVMRWIGERINQVNVLKTTSG